ncbi:C40 family peptidase [Pseudactinotalea terrae]|uniref:C40 family peptidase n=1 Tax=Pseudactinotalea terrae TaxID=1743262 RepID=UPI0012E0FB1F|nr:C40 family peptidase [Pseudactinotalea terrae]
MSRSASARHRAAARPTTPLSSVGSALTGPAARRAVVAAASSGIVLTLTASASVAGGLTAPAARGPVPMANLTAIADDDAIATSPTITVAADATWAFSSTAADVSSEPPPPPPPPPPPVVQRPTYTSTTTSRTAERTAVETATTASAPANPSGSAIVDIARRYTGVPYVYGGASPSGFDCSGFTMYVFAQVGISLPRSSSAQRYAGTVVSAADARPGDLVWAPGHVGIYTGNGMHIAARSPGTPLYESQIYMSNPVFIRVG